MDGKCTTRGRDEECLQNLVVKSDGKRPVGTPTSSCDNRLESIMDVK